jgi:hypothetical protein
LYTDSTPSLSLVRVFKGILSEGDEIPILGRANDRNRIFPLVARVVQPGDFLVFLTGYQDTLFGCLTDSSQQFMETDVLGSRRYGTEGCLVSHSDFWDKLPNDVKDSLAVAAAKNRI